MRAINFLVTVNTKNSLPNAFFQHFFEILSSGDFGINLHLFDPKIHLDLKPGNGIQFPIWRKSFEATLNLVIMSLFRVH